MISSVGCRIYRFTNGSARHELQGKICNAREAQGTLDSAELLAGRVNLPLVYSASMATDTSSRRDFLRSISLFGGLEDASLERVEGMLVEHSFAQGAIVCSEGDQGRSMYVVASGEVEVRRANSKGEPVPIVRLGRGELFGEMTLIEIQPRSATVVVIEPSTLYALTKKDLYTLYVEDLNAYILVLQNICRQLSRRLRKADSRISELLTSSVSSDQTAPDQFAVDRSS